LGFHHPAEQYLQGGSLLLQNGVITYTIYIYIYNLKKMATENTLKMNGRLISFHTL